MKNQNEKQLPNLQLSKDSNPEQIKTYFQQVFKFKSEGEEFPVFLDAVWPLVYERKDVAVRALRNSNIFVNGIDYQVSHINAESLKGGKPNDVYSISLPCLEYFIARKVRPVFEVYRKLAHEHVESAQLKPNENTVLIGNIHLAITPSAAHGFLVTTPELSRAFKITDSTIRSLKAIYKNRFKKDIHYVDGFQSVHIGEKKCSTAFTKAGLLQFAYHFRTGASIHLRTWAEQELMNINYKPVVNTETSNPERMVSILEDICKIDDKELRLSLMNKIKGGDVLC